MRCDLHVHTIASGRFGLAGIARVCKESYSEPAEVYNRLKRLGMSLVTITDHDSIEAAESLRHHPDFFVSEEVTVQMPSGTEMHLGVYNLTERNHVEVQRRRNDFVSLLMYVTERRLFFSVNHAFSSLTGRREEDDFRWWEAYVPAYETRNGQMWREANQSAGGLAARLAKIAIAGSDSHTTAGVGLTYTEVPGARSVEEFFAGLRAGQGRVKGEHGSYGKLTADVFRIIRSLFLEKPWTVMLSPLAVFVPVITMGHWVNEMRFCRKWTTALENSQPSKRIRWNMHSSFEGNWAS